MNVIYNRIDDRPKNDNGYKGNGYFYYYHIEIIQFNYDGKGGYLFIADGEKIVSDNLLSLNKLLTDPNYKLCTRKMKINNILNEE